MGVVVLSTGGVISPNPVAIARSMTMVILWCIGFYFLYLLFLSSLTKDEKESLILFVILFFVAVVL